MPTAPRTEPPDPRQRAPFVLEWGRGGRPLPYRVLTARGHRRAGPPEFDPALVPTGDAGRPFDFCGHIRRLCAAIVTRCEGLYHIDADRVLITVMQARNGRAAGLQARVTPLRFRDGALTRPFRGREYQVQRFRLDGREQLYVMTFCLPRFLDQPFEEKLVTLFHELFHIGPAFDGDLRRHAGRYEVHSHSQKAYDGKMGELAKAYLNGRADPALHAFLRLNFAQLEQKHGAVVGVVVPRPKLLPVPRIPSPTQY